MSRDLALAELAKIRASADALEAFFMREAPPANAPAPARGLAEPGRFFEHLRGRPPLGPTLSQGEVAGCERILAACAGAGFPPAWTAYALATCVHETAGAMAPVREYGKGAGRVYGKPGRNGGQVAYGRGDVQLTWDENYERADRELGLNGALVADYDLALDPQVSARVLVSGMEGGWFTGKGLRLYLPEVARRDQFVAARKIVNGTDRAELIAGYAETFQGALQAGGWR
ncbi:MAG: hypothetical protein ACREEO_02235 [Phenylobacterium sp.]